MYSIALGGNVAKVGDGKGYYIEPTVFTNVHLKIEIVQEEIFDNVVVVSKLKTEEEVPELAIFTTYGLEAAVHTKDYERVVRVTNELQAGTTWVNMFINFVHWSIPFGGYKVSDLGRECAEGGAGELHRGQGRDAEHGDEGAESIRYACM